MLNSTVRRFFPVATALLLAGSILAPRGVSQSLGKEGDCRDSLNVTGRYVNVGYGFEVTIPRGMIGRWNSSACYWGEVQTGDRRQDECLCMTDHGRFIKLPHQGMIDTYAGHTPDFEISVRRWALDNYEQFGEDDALITRVRGRFFRKMRLDGLPAFRFQVEYERKGVTWIREEIVARRDR